MSEWGPEPPEDDGLLIAEVGDWSTHKHHFLRRYLDAFVTSMHEKGWESLHYVDLFAGAGVERLATAGRLEWGSPLIAAQARYPFKSLHLCEADNAKWAALRGRLKRLRPDREDQLILGDANESVTAVVDAIPERALTLAFLDPYGLHLEFDTLVALATRRADLIIYFPDRVDLLRNAVHYYFENPNSNADRVLGKDADWRAVWEAAPEKGKAHAMRQLYIRQIERLGFTHFEIEPVPSAGAPLYSLIFCSKANVALRIWRRVSEKKPDGQRTFEFDDSAG